MHPNCNNLNNVLFTHRGEPALRNREGYDPTKDSDDIVGAFGRMWMYGELDENDTVHTDANRHEQEDGTILAVAATGILVIS